MKKNIIFLSFALFLIIACTKSQKFQNAEQNRMTSTALENFKDISAKTEQKMAYSLLTIEERIILAEEHIDFCISYFNLNNNQIYILQQIKMKLELMINSSDPETNVNVIWMEDQITNNFSTMDQEELALIFSSMVCSEEDVDGWLAPSPTGGGGAGVDCNCSVSSNYCTGISGGGGAWIPCKTKTNCKDSSWGCGSLLLYACKGICSIFG